MPRLGLSMEGKSNKQMADPTIQSSGAQALRPRARILRTLGDELISSETVAVIELVKNAFDADATRVLVRFQAPLEIGRGRIEVIDNGHGMSLETIQTTWMEPATLSRKREPHSELRKRRVLGEKGVGRFAASRLADYLEVVTRRAEMTTEVRALFDWKQFDDAEKYLDQVEVLWEEARPAEICSGGTIQELWSHNESSAVNDLSHGTILRMDGVRTLWGEDEFKTLRTGLSRLISPFFVRDLMVQSDEFKILLDLPGPYTYLSGAVELSKAFDQPHYMLKGDVDDDGGYKLSIRLRGQTEFESVSGQFVLPDEHKPQCGPFDIELRAWDREAKDLAELVEVSGSTLKDVRRDLDAVAGVNVYRDGFRVFPYGEPNNDWLRLDLRRVQKPRVHLSNNQIMGYLLLSADRNPELRDQSNREGLIAGPALEDLRGLVYQILALLESKRYAIREKSRKQEPRKGGVFTDFNLNGVHALIRQRHPEDTELLAFVEEKAQDLQARVQEVQEILARYRRLATLGQLIDTVLHDGRAPLSAIGQEAHLGLRDIERAPKIDQEPKLILRLSQRLNVIENQSDVLATVFRRIEPFGGRKPGRPTRVRLEQVIADAFAVLRSAIADVKARVDLPETETIVTADQAEIQEVIINLLQNSLYWLRHVPIDDRSVVVKVHRRDADRVDILFSDSGPGVDPVLRDYIFDPYFSTKPDGVGLGLTIAGEIVNEFYAGELALLDTGPLPGATFRISLHKRV